MTKENKLCRKQLFVLLALVGIAIAVAFMYRNSTTQQGAFAYHLDLMEYYYQDNTERTTEYPLYPLWGYPLLLGLFQNYRNIIYVQALTGSLALFCFYTVISKNLFSRTRKRIWLGLVLTALPYYSLLSVKWPAAFQLSFLLASTSTIIIAFRKDRMRYAVIAGILQGLACNFRSEYLYYPVFILILILVFKIMGVIDSKKSIFKQILIYCVFSYVMMIPLGIERYYRTGTYNIKTGNSDFVNLFFSIGQYSNNSLGLRFEDGWIEDYLHENIQENYDSTTPLHMQAVANEFCKERYILYVKSEPANYAGKILHNLKSILIGGFYCGQLESLYPEEQRYNILLVKEYYKSIIGNRNYSVNMNLLYDNNLISRRDSIFRSDINLNRVLSALPFYLLNFSFIAILWGMVIIIPLDVYKHFRSRSKISAEELLLLAPIAYACILMALGLYENRFTSMIYMYITAYVVQKIPLKIIPMSTRTDKSKKV